MNLMAKSPEGDYTYGGLIHHGETPPPSGEYWVVIAYQHQGLNQPMLVKYINGVDKKNNPTYTDLINEAFKFDSWTSIKKFWRSTTCKLPDSIPTAGIKMVKEPFGKKDIMK